MDEEELQDYKIEVYGEDEHDKYQRLEFNFLPCVEDLENNLCVNRTLEEIKEYLGAPNFLIYHNHERFN